MIIGSKELIRDMNTRLVLETIINHQSISRASIAKELGLTKATISAIVQDLMNKGLVLEIGSDDTSLGRKPILLSFNKRAGYAASIDIGLNTVSILVTDLLGESRNLKRIKTPNVSKLVRTITDILTGMLTAVSDTLYGLVGIAIGVHGIVSDNRVVFTPYYDIEKLHIAEKLSAFFSVPVFLENEANLSVIGEETYISNAYKNIININIHSGVGIGLIIDNKLYTGDHGLAGEFGHTIVALNGHECPCGNRGCLEQYLSEQALIKEFGRISKNADATLDEFVKAYHKNDEHALYIANQFTDYLTLCLNNILNSLNPDIIIINSSFTFLFPELAEKSISNLSSAMNDQIPIHLSKLQDMSTLLGGICLIVKDFLKIEQIFFN